jgi:hypothetical protein
VPSDSIILPLDVACERSGLSEDELTSIWCVQTMTRVLPDREETAVLVPRSVVQAVASLVEKDVRELDALASRLTTEPDDGREDERD